MHTYAHVIQGWLTVCVCVGMGECVDGVCVCVYVRTYIHVIRGQ